MAVTKLWKFVSKLQTALDYVTDPDKTDKSKFGKKYSIDDYQALKDVLEYAKNEEKTEKELYVSAINCNKDYARSMFIEVKEQFGKTDGIQAYHGYMSFAPDEVTPDQAHKIGIEFAQRVWGKRFQVVVTTHLNTRCLHNHFVINSVSFVDGKRLQNEEKAWIVFHHIADEICKEHKLSVIENPKRVASNRYLTIQDNAGMPTRYNLLREAIDEAIENSRNIRDFQAYLTKMGYTYKISDNRKYWSVVPKGWNKPVRLQQLGDDYTNVRIRERIEENNNPYRLRSFQRATNEKPKPPVDIRKCKGSLYNLYLYYLYLLNDYKKDNKKNNARLHYLLKEDLMKLDKISQSTRLLAENNIDTAEQLFLYKEQIDKDIKQLTADRKALRNKERRKNTSADKLSEYKLQISKINDMLKQLRREAALCDDIVQRSQLVQDNVEQIVAEEKSKNKNERRTR